MTSYQKRVVRERRELEKKIQRLRAFRASPSWAKTPGDEQRRMIRQVKLMVEYKIVLAERIAAFPASSGTSKASGYSA